jgi:hypothetical protein
MFIKDVFVITKSWNTDVLQWMNIKKKKLAQPYHGILHSNKK